MKKDLVIELLSDRAVAYRADITKAFKSIQAGVFMSQLLYWSGKEHDPDGWIRKDVNEFYEETGMTRKNQDTARKILSEAGALEEKLKGMPAKLHYKINFNNLVNHLKEYYYSLPERGKLDRPKGANKIDRSGRFFLYREYNREYNKEYYRKTYYYQK